MTQTILATHKYNIISTETVPSVPFITYCKLCINVPAYSDIVWTRWLDCCSPSFLYNTEKHKHNASRWNISVRLISAIKTWITSNCKNNLLTNTHPTVSPFAKNCNLRYPPKGVTQISRKIIEYPVTYKSVYDMALSGGHVDENVRPRSISHDAVCTE